jgi:hypothetical protein
VSLARPVWSVCETEALECPFRAAADPRPGFHWSVLQRHGRRPLAVLSRVLLQADNRCAGLPWWSELCIHETAGGGFAASLRHSPAGLGGQAWTDAWLCDGADTVRGIFLTHDIAAALPPDGLDDPRHAASMCRVRGAWWGLLAAVFGVRPDP